MSNEAYAIYNELDRVLTFYYDEFSHPPKECCRWVKSNIPDLCL